MATDRDLEFMRLAVKEARRSVHKDHRIHPEVGAVVVRDGEVQATACHGDRQPCDHAEFTVLEQKLKGESLAGSIVYTTLEPCCTTRKHPKVSCAARLIERRVSRVAIGMLDPNQTITGKGILQLRRAGIAVDLFPPDLMAEIEDLNREFIREHQLSDLASPTTGAAEAGLRVFYPSRDYARFRKDAATIDRYVATAQHSAILVSINLMTGIPFHDLCDRLREKLTSSGSQFQSTISLLNPFDSALMSVVAPVLKKEPADLAHTVRQSVCELLRFKQSLPRGAQKRFDIRVHHTLPFGSAIILDHGHANGRIQIETKPYKAGVQQSLAFEIGPTEHSNLYTVLVTAFETLLKDGRPISIVQLEDFCTTAR